MFSVNMWELTLTWLSFTSAKEIWSPILYACIRSPGKRRVARAHPSESAANGAPEPEVFAWECDERGRFATPSGVHERDRA